MQRDRNRENSRLSFIKKASLGIVSVFGLSWTVLNSKPSENNNSTYNLISDEEANDLLKNMAAPKSQGVRPLPPPNTMESKEEE
jgi:hypothetical protein